MSLLKEIEKTEIWIQVEPFIDEMGISVLFWRESRSRSTLKIELTLFSFQGLSMDLIEKVYRLLLPRIEVIWGSDNIILDISSPGIERKIKSLYELPFFLGKGMDLYLKNQSQSIEGILKAVDEENITIKTKEETLVLLKEDLRKVKLKG